MTADKWINHIKDMNRILGKKTKKSPTPEYKKVKIAILDTGIRKDTPEAPSPHWHRIKAYKDFVLKNNEDGIDNTGHGTNGVHLIFQCIADAEIYVGRVFEFSDAGPNTVDLMTEVSFSLVFNF